MKERTMTARGFLIFASPVEPLIWTTSAIVHSSIAFTRQSYTTGTGG
jgi:hypothetical protein